MSHTCDIIISKYINLGSPARFDSVQLSVALTGKGKEKAVGLGKSGWDEVEELR